jgi:hypothetical protein
MTEGQTIHWPKEREQKYKRLNKNNPRKYWR